MITGFNTDIQHGGVTYHVQTEDKGLETPLILSLVYVGGAIIASKRSRYEDLIESGFDEQALTERLQRQHKLICAAIKSGRVEDLKKMAEPPAKRDTAKLKETAKTDEAPKTDEQPTREAQPKQDTPPKQDAQPTTKAQPTTDAPPAADEQKPERTPRREPARRAEPPARTRETQQQDSPQPPPSQPPQPQPPQTTQPPRPSTPEKLREAPPAKTAAPVAPPASEPAPSLLRGEDQYLDPAFLRGSTGALAPEQGFEVERTPEPPPPSQPTPSLPPAPSAPPASALPPPVLISPDAVRVIEEPLPLAGEEIYVTLLDDEGEFRAGQLATIKIRVGRGQFGQRAVADAAVTIKVLGTTFRPLILSTRTGADGVAVVRALLPRFTSGRAAIIIRASSGEEFAEMRRIIHQA